MSSANNSLSSSVEPTEKTVVKNMPLHLTSKKNLSPLLQLPRELRDEIYRRSIAAGNLSILSLSKFVNAEASELLSKHAVLRVNLGFVNRTNWSQLGSASVATVRHLDLRLNTSPHGALPFNIDVISGFFDKQIIRESCIVMTNYGKEGSAPNLDHSILYQQLARLHGFKKLVFKIVLERYEAAEFRGILTVEKFHELFPYDESLLQHHRQSYVKVKRFLEPTMGRGDFDDSVGGHCLEFHPLDSVPEDSNPEFQGDY